MLLAACVKRVLPLLVLAVRTDGSALLFRHPSTAVWLLCVMLVAARVQCMLPLLVCAVKTDWSALSFSPPCKSVWLLNVPVIFPHSSTGGGFKDNKPETSI